jgi:hypothetical protein
MKTLTQTLIAAVLVTTTAIAQADEINEPLQMITEGKIEATMLQNAAPEEVSMIEEMESMTAKIIKLGDDVGLATNVHGDSGGILKALGAAEVELSELTNIAKIASYEGNRNRFDSAYGEAVRAYKKALLLPKFPAQ